MKLASGVALFLLCTMLAAQQDDDMKKKTAKLKAEMTKIRGLEFKNEVTVGVYSKDELQKFIMGEFERELPRAKAKKFEKVYVHFGLIPKGMDLFDSLVVLLSDSIAGFYHSKTKELRLVKEEGEDPSNAMGFDMEAITLVHELCHAAQDQNFDLTTVPMEEKYNDEKHSEKAWTGAQKEELKKVERFKAGLWSCKDHPAVEKDVNSYCSECGQRLTVENPKKEEKKPKKEYR